MAKSDDYQAGYRDGRNNFLRNSGDRNYRQGYAVGKQEYDFWNDKDLYPSLRGDEPEQFQQQSNPLSSDLPTLGTMIGGSIALAILWWAFAGLILLLLWIGGQSDSFWFHLLFQISLWGSIGFIVIMTIIGIITTIAEKYKNWKQR